MDRKRDEAGNARVAVITGGSAGIGRATAREFARRGYNIAVLARGLDRLGAVAMAIAGAVYGRLFGRAANDRSGGWLFGMAYGFLLWAAGAVMILPAVSGGTAPGGRAAIGVLLALLAWGTALGTLFPAIH